MTDNVSQIKERLNIVDVVNGYVRLNKAGVNYKALCPFHNEKTPSFMVSPARQNWHCFGCSEGGDIFTFIEKIEGVEFLEALKILAEKAGVTLEHIDPKIRSEKDRIYEICEKAAQFFSQKLSNPNLQIHPNTTNNNVITDYLYGRGLNDKTIEEWRLGYAPDSWDSLLLFLKTEGYKDAEIEKAGLILESHPAPEQVRYGARKYHDRFRNRLMFPIFDTGGRVVAFSGRIMNDIIPSKTEKADSGKYINSPETILFSKSRVLYGLDKAKTEIRKANRAVLVEGQMDLLLPWQDGIKNVVATSGTALTENHLTTLKRLSDNLILAFDMDEAGFKATKRGVDLAQAVGFNIMIIDLESGKDPADFVAENPGRFAAMVETAKPIMAYYINQIFKKFSPPEHRAGISGETDIKLEIKKIIAINLLSEIKRLPSAVERSGWIRELSLRLGVSERDLMEEMERIELEDPVNEEKYQRESAFNRRSSVPVKTRKEILSERLLALLLKNPELVSEAAGSAAFLPKTDFNIFEAFIKSSNFSDIRESLPQEARPYLDFLYLAGDYEFEKMGGRADLGGEIKILTKDIEKEHYKEMLAKMDYEIKKREADGNIDLGDLMKEFQNISNKINILNQNKNGKEKTA